MTWTVRDLFDRISEVRPEARAAEFEAVLSAGCPETTLEEVRRLLACDSGASSQAESSELSVMRAAAERTAMLGAIQQVGRYRVDRVLGRGGFGVVFLAEQETPFRRTVAVKVLDPGKASPVSVQRFELEREALASVHHPGIATLLDAGVTDLGQTYIVMELVAGQRDGVTTSAPSITDYCDEHRVGIPQRLELFRAVCQAVQHAHGRGVIHRDIKPSNVLVADLDGRPVPKVIDFGIARLTSGSNSTVTEAGEPLGSLAYMSPEQAKGDLGTTVQTDVYGLGVLLYQLLSGLLPIDTQSSSRQQALESITAGDLPSACTRFVNHAAIVDLGHDGPPTAATISANRSLTVPQLTRTLRGELGWILRKAMEPRLDRRYATAAALESDISAYERHEPVTAGPERSWYRASKFARRHLALVGGAAIVFIALTVALGISLYGLHQYRAAGDLAGEQIEAIAQHLKSLGDLDRPEALEWAKFGTRMAEAASSTHPVRAAEAFHWSAILLPQGSPQRRQAFFRSYECLRDSKQFAANWEGVLWAADGLTECGEPGMAKSAVDALVADSRGVAGQEGVLCTALLYRVRMRDLAGSLREGLDAARSAHAEVSTIRSPNVWIFKWYEADLLNKLADAESAPDRQRALREQAAKTLQVAATEFDSVKQTNPGPEWARNNARGLCERLGLGDEEKRRWTVPDKPSD